MSDNWARLVNTTTPNYLRKVEVNIIRKRKLLALMESKGRIKMNCFGDYLDWKVEYKQQPLRAYADGGGIDYPRSERHKTAQLPFRSYVMTDSMTDREKEQNKGDAAIVKSYSTIIESMARACRDQFGDELYIDGYDAANTDRIHGIESFMGGSVSLQNGCIKPDDKYAELATLPGSYGGIWNNGAGLTPSTSAYPIGTGDVHFDFFSPTLVNYTDATSGVYSAASKTWKNTNQEAMRKLITKTTRSSSQDGRLDLIMLNEELFEGFKNSIPQELMIQRNQPVGLVALGFTDAMNFDGIDGASEYGVPANVGYGFNTMEMELQSLKPTLLESRGPDFNKSNYSWDFSIIFMGNARFNPKFFGKLKNYS